MQINGRFDSSELLRHFHCRVYGDTEMGEYCLFLAVGKSLNLDFETTVSRGYPILIVRLLYA